MTYKSRKEDPRSRRRAPVLRQDGIVQLPHVPVAPAQHARRRGRRGAAEEHDEHLAREDARRLGPRRLRRPRGVARHVGLVDEDGAQRRADGVDGLEHGPDERGAAQLRVLVVEGEAADAAAVGVDGPPEDAEERGGRVQGLDDEQVAEDGGVHEHDGELDDPEEEEGEEVLGCDPGGVRQMVGHLVPGCAEDGPQADRRDHATLFE